MDAQRALLDELMGVSRDGEREEVSRKFSDDDVCKYYIQGFCFMDEFQRTKHSYGVCDKAHDDACKTQWESLSDSEKAKYPYEKELWDWIEKMMSDLRSKVRRNQERISQPGALPIMASDQTKMAEMDAEIKSLVKQSEELGEQGDVDAAQTAATRAERLKVERMTFEEDAKKAAQDSLNRYGEQEVCPYSGVIINSEESRLRDHKSGKNYRTWVHVHEKRKELEETFASRGTHPTGGTSRVKDQERGANRDGDRERPSSRTQDRDRIAEKDRYRDRDRRGRERSRERGSSRDHRHRDDYRERDYPRDRDRDRRRSYH